MSKKRNTVVEKLCGGKAAKYLDIPVLSIDNIRKGLSDAYIAGKDYKHDIGVEVLNTPFQCCIIKNFLQDGDFLERLKNDLMSLPFKEKSSDLFHFQQTDDLVNCNIGTVTSVRTMLFNSVRQWVADVRNICLDTTIDLSCAKYNYSDVLLCHDDQLEGRRIAFIYYLVPEDWSIEDGGCFDMFSTDKTGQPDEIVRSIVPTYNTFLFFEVTNKSYHQVSEVLSESKTRLTLSGWFHGENLTSHHMTQPAKIVTIPALPAMDEILLEWINPTYLTPDIVDDISEQFEDESEIQLRDFLTEEKYMVIMNELSTTACWVKEGPPNFRCCWVMKNGTKKLPILAELQKLLTCQPFFKLISKLTGLQLAVLDEEEDTVQNSKTTAPPRCSLVVRKWFPGCYTLLHDDEACGKEYMLDAILHFTEDTWDVDDGGSINYLAKDTGEEILSVHPVTNCLSLVYRDGKTSRFVKYINHAKILKNSYDMSLVYMEGD